MGNALWNSPEGIAAMADDVVRILAEANARHTTEQKPDRHAWAVRECQLREHRINNLIRCIAALEDVMTDNIVKLKADLATAVENMGKIVAAVSVVEQQGIQKDSLISELRAQLAAGSPVTDEDLAALQTSTDAINAQIVEVRDLLLGMEGTDSQTPPIPSIPTEAPAARGR